MDLVWLFPGGFSQSIAILSLRLKIATRSFDSRMTLIVATPPTTEQDYASGDATRAQAFDPAIYPSISTK
jgi:hypothetical protein